LSTDGQPLACAGRPLSRDNGFWEAGPASRATPRSTAAKGPKGRYDVAWGVSPRRAMGRQWDQGASPGRRLAARPASGLSPLAQVPPFQGFGWWGCTSWGLHPRLHRPAPFGGSLGKPPAPEPQRDGWFLPHPYPMPPNFTGRVAERAMLDRWLDAHPLLSLRALGGFGKSAVGRGWRKHPRTLGMPPGCGRIPPQPTKAAGPQGRHRAAAVLYALASSASR
jgi:hypothetical protein